MPGLGAVLCKHPAEGPRGPHCPPAHSHSAILYVSGPGVLCVSSTYFSCVFLQPKILFLTPFVWLTLTCPVALSLDVISSRKYLPPLTELDALRRVPVPPPSDHLVPSSSISWPVSPPPDQWLPKGRYRVCLVHCNICRENHCSLFSV